MFRVNFHPGFLKPRKPTTEKMNSFETEEILHKKAT
jgi:hypothetical protein